MNNLFPDLSFRNPELLWMSLIIPVLIWYFFQYKRKSRPRISISSTEAFSTYRPTFRQRLLNVPIVLRLIALCLLIVALARPQSTMKGSSVTTEGISIVLALDVSTSMLAEDFRPNRIEAAKRVALDFIEGRPNDLIGMVIFSGESFTQCPITSDHAVLINMMKDLRTGLLTDGTAIGEGLATAIDRIKDSNAKSKVILLITDGVNNAGSIPPLTAGEIAKAFGIRIYTVGVGTKGMAPYPFKTPFGIQYQNMEVQIDEKLLSEIATSTGGKYFRATNNKALVNVFAEIDQMEKTRIEVTEYRRYSEEYLPWALSACVLFLIEFVLRNSILRSIP